LHFIVAIITLFFSLSHMFHSAAEAEAKQKAAEEEASNRAAAEAAAGLLPT
jgi:uncharacterized protein (UPF0333 family)